MIRLISSVFIGCCIAACSSPRGGGGGGSSKAKGCNTNADCPSGQICVPNSFAGAPGKADLFDDCLAKCIEECQAAGAPRALCEEQCPAALDTPEGRAACEEEFGTGGAGAGEGASEGEGASGEGAGEGAGADGIPDGIPGTDAGAGTDGGAATTGTGSSEESFSGTCQTPQSSDTGTGDGTGAGAGTGEGTGAGTGDGTGEGTGAGTGDGTGEASGGATEGGETTGGGNCANDPDGKSCESSDNCTVGCDCGAAGVVSSGTCIDGVCASAADTCSEACAGFDGQWSGGCQ